MPLYKMNEQVITHWPPLEQKAINNDPFNAEHAHKRFVIFNPHNKKRDKKSCQYCGGTGFMHNNWNPKKPIKCRCINRRKVNEQ